MPISGVVIRCRPDRTEELAREVGRPGEIEVHGMLPDGRLVAVIEADTVDGEMETVNRLLATDGVIDVQLAYHNFEDLCEGSGRVAFSGKGEA